MKNAMINNKSQGSVATHLKYGRVFSIHITANLLLSLLMKKK